MLAIFTISRSPVLHFFPTTVSNFEQDREAFVQLPSYIKYMIENKIHIYLLVVHVINIYSANNFILKSKLNHLLKNKRKNESEIHKKGLKMF